MFKRSNTIINLFLEALSMKVFGDNFIANLTDLLWF